MTVTAYYSSDTHAPSVGIAAQAFFTTILTACLVNGYTGKSAAGWTSAYTGSTGQVAYQQGAGSNGFFLNVDDSAASANGSNARVQMFETMSAFGTGTNGTPTTAQISGGGYFPRGNNGTDTLPGRWLVIADAKRFYMWHEGTSTSGTTGFGVVVGFGDIDTFGASDIYATLLMAYSGSGPSGAGGMQHGGTTMVSLSSGNYMMRRFDQLSTGCQITKSWDYVKGGQTAYMGNSTAATALAYPNPVDGGIYVSPVWVSEAIVSANPVLRGVVPGIWAPLHYLVGTPASVLALDTVTGSGLTAGKTFTFCNCQANGNAGWVCFETSNTWS